MQNSQKVMQIYLVGGAVRDALLGLEVRERDWLVTGSDCQSMIAAGFRQVGNFFPVFLHPESAEEYALARRERKTGPGHQGFSFDAATSVEDDLRRRDLTINAMAMDASGRVVDPYGGRHDLHERVLRHVSPAFAEDPLRVLRVARFASQLSRFDFRIAETTLELMRSMARSADYRALSSERVWQESSKALLGPQPLRFWRELQRAEALSPWFDELTAIDFAAAEVDMAAVASSAERWLLLLNLLPKGVELETSLRELHKRLKAPSEFADCAALLAVLRGDLATALASPERCLQVIERCDALRRPQRLMQVLNCGLAVALINADAMSAWLRALASLRALPIAELTRGIAGKDMRSTVRVLRLQALAAALT